MTTMNIPENESLLVDLSYLNRQFGGRKDQVREIVNLFIAHTPLAIVEIKQLVEEKAWQNLSSKIHSIKSYYGYLGNNALLQKLVGWEQALKENPDAYNHREMINDLDRKTLLIIERLKQTLLEGL